VIRGVKEGGQSMSEEVMAREIVNKAVKPRAKTLVAVKGDVPAKDLARLKKIQRQILESLDEARSILQLYPVAYEKSRIWMDRATFSIRKSIVPYVSPSVTMEDTIKQIEEEGKP
jgi:hypothetical protein